MKERDSTNEPYWSLDRELGEASFDGSRFTVRLEFHRSEESYRDRENEIIPLSQTRGQRTYMHARPYILLPEIEVTIALSGESSGDGAIGTVIGSEVHGMRKHDIGKAQAWYYPADRTAILWECYLFNWYREGDDPSADSTLRTVWRGFEHVVGEQFPVATHVATPSWENIYDRDEWQGFLRQQGYEAFTKSAFRKGILRV